MSTETTVDAPASVDNVIPPTAPLDSGSAPAGNEATKVAATEPGNTETREEPRGVAKRLKELTDARRAAEAREERLLKLLEQQHQPSFQPPSEPDKGLSDFGYDEKKYAAYVAKQTATTAAEAARKEFEKLQTERESASRRAVYEARAEAFAKTVEDFETVLDGKWACSEPMAELIEESDEGPAIAYYLAQNPDEAAKLARLSAAKAGKEIARIEDKLVSERKKAAEKPVTKAPAPTPKIEAVAPGMAVSAASPESDKLSMKEWAKAWEREHRKKG